MKTESINVNPPLQAPLSRLQSPVCQVEEDIYTSQSGQHEQRRAEEFFLESVNPTPGKAAIMGLKWERRAINADATAASRGAQAIQPIPPKNRSEVWAKVPIMQDWA